MSVGCFRVSFNQETLDLRVDVIEPDSAAIPATQIAFYQRVVTLKSVLDQIKVQFGRNSSHLIPFYLRLVSIAETGLQGFVDESDPSLRFPAYPELAALDLTLFETDLLEREGALLKRILLRRLARVAGNVAIPMLIISFGSQRFIVATKGFEAFQAAFQFFVAFAPFAVGSMIALWISTAIRKRTLTIADLRSFDDDRLDPVLRTLLVFLISLVGFAMLRAGLLDVKIGAISSKSLFDSRLAAFLFGFGIGFSERSFSDGFAGRFAGLVAPAPVPAVNPGAGASVLTGQPNAGGAALQSGPARPNNEVQIREFFTKLTTFRTSLPSALADADLKRFSRQPASVFCADEAAKRNFLQLFKAAFGTDLPDGFDVNRSVLELTAPPATEIEKLLVEFACSLKKGQPADPSLAVSASFATQGEVEAFFAGLKSVLPKSFAETVPLDSAKTIAQIVHGTLF